ncbi:putative caspase-like protein, partial [Rhodoblastus acidophilus]|uniref:caspase family protein n=2 Tax=Rhodoblastus acidophilus TaxID=1074 RepID=UPI002224E65F
MTRKAKNIRIRVAAGALALSGLFAALAQVVAQPAPAVGNRLALVIGESAYRTGPVASAANDAGLIAQTLQVAGFDVTGAADLDQEGLRKTLREFVEKAGAAGPDATVFIYLSGRALQYEGENYFAPIEAAIPAAANVPLETVRLADYLTPLAQMPLKARIVVLDAARANNFAPNQPLAGGLALVDPPPGELIAFNAAPGTVAPNETGPYGVYAQALNEMMRRGGVPVDQVFDSVRLRVAEQTKGAQIPWDESKLSPAPVLLARADDAPPPQAAPDLRSRPIRDYAVDQAYAAALERDTIAGYVEFLDAFPKSPYSARVRAILAVRREALTWRRARNGDTAEAYWTYLRRFPRGPHAEDARRRLAILRAEMAPPPRFAEYEFDVPPPPEWETQEDAIYFRRPYVVFDDPDYGPPPPRVEFLPPPVFYDEPPPPPPQRNLLPLPLVAAPLLFAVPAIRHGLFHAPAPVQAQNPGAQQYYDERARPAPPPGGFPQGGPRPGQQGGAPQPGAPGLAPQQPGAPAAQQPGQPPVGSAPVIPGGPRPGQQGGAPQPGAPGLAPQQPGAPATQQPGQPPVGSAPVIPGGPRPGQQGGAPQPGA